MSFHLMALHRIFAPLSLFLLSPRGVSRVSSDSKAIAKVRCARLMRFVAFSCLFLKAKRFRRALSP